MGIRGGSQRDPALKLGDPTEMDHKKWYKMRGSDETTYPLYNIIKEAQDLTDPSGIGLVAGPSRILSRKLKT